MDNPFLSICSKDFLPMALYKDQVEIFHNDLFSAEISARGRPFLKLVGEVVKRASRQLGKSYTAKLSKCDVYEEIACFSMKNDSVFLLVVLIPNKGLVRNASTLLKGVSTSFVMVFSKEAEILFCSKSNILDLQSSDPQLWKDIVKVALQTIDTGSVNIKNVKIKGRSFRIVSTPSDGNALLFFEDITEEKKFQKMLDDYRKIATSLSLIELTMNQVKEGSWEVEKLGQSIFEATTRITPVDAFYLVMLNGEELVIRFGYAEGQTITGYSFPRGFRGFSNYVLDMGKTIYIGDTKNFSAPPYKAISIFPGEEDISWSYLGIPLKVEGNFVGVLSFQKKKPHAFSPLHISLFEILAREVEVGFFVKHILEELSAERNRFRELAVKDFLTHCYSRRYLHEFLEKMASLLERQKGKNAFLMVDVNDFKAINDRYGHRVGDIVLQKVADVLMKSVRKMDIVVRFGGDEFIVVLPKAGAKEARQVAKRFEKNLAQSKVEVLDEPLSVSWGISVFDGKENIEAVIDKADKAMYRMKDMYRKGRSQK